MTNDHSTIIFRVGTLIAVLNLIGLVAFWAGGLSQRVAHLEDGIHIATENRWTKRDDDQRHELVMVQINTIKNLLQKNLWIKDGDFRHAEE